MFGAQTPLRQFQQQLQCLHWAVAFTLQGLRVSQFTLHTETSGCRTHTREEFDNCQNGTRKSFSLSSACFLFKCMSGAKTCSKVCLISCHLISCDKDNVCEQLQPAHSDSTRQTEKKNKLCHSRMIKRVCSLQQTFSFKASDRTTVFICSCHHQEA